MSMWGGLRMLVLDAWSPLSHKRALEDGSRMPTSRAWQPPLWAGWEHHRRLMAYHVLEAYDRQMGRRFLDAMSIEEQREVREYGDAHAINRTVLAAVMGNTQTLRVPGATPDDGDEDPELVAAQDWYRQWWEDESGPRKQRRAERRAVKLGNGIFTLGWDPDAGRVRLRDYDPGWYFPVWADGDDDEFPSRVHLAWEIPDPATGLAVALRRITFDLHELPDGQTRSYPWRQGRSSRMACYLTDATWAMTVLAGADIDSLAPDNAEYRVDGAGEVRERDLGIDFVPVVSLPNTVDDGDGWGEPTIAAVTQILDDLSQTDTDLQASAATAAKPVVFVSGASLADGALAYDPGMVMEAGDGTATVLNTAHSLDALLKHLNSLLARLSVNARVPDSVLGRVSPAEVPSGIALALSFGPLASLVADMRLARAEQYRLLFAFARRIALAAQAPGVPTSDAPCDMVFGAYLPQDRAAAVNAVRELLGAAGEVSAISLETAVAILVAAGVPIEDATAEVALIRRTDYLAAGQLNDATADPVAVRSLLASGELPALEGPPPPPDPAPGPAPEPEPGDPALPLPPGARLTPTTGGQRP